MPYTDAEYEYFEQRQLPARPPGAPPTLHPLLQHQDKRPQEEQVYAEPILVNNPPPPVNISNPLGEFLILSQQQSPQILSISSLFKFLSDLALNQIFLN